MDFFRRRTPVNRDCRLPAGERVYAVGDIHGRLDLLDAMLGLIAADSASRPPSHTTVIFLGDLVDRGPDLRGVVARVRELFQAGGVRLIKGNHEEVFVEAARGCRHAASALVRIGGMATILSYGISEAEAREGSFADLAHLLQRRIPPDDVNFLDKSESCVVLGDYVFVHAGLKPGLALRDRGPRDLRWIRASFTESDHFHGHFVIHGHSISPAIEERKNRVGLDTGAFASGRLSAMGIESADRWFLQAEGAADDPAGMLD